MGCHFIQEIFPTQESNLCLLHLYIGRGILYHVILLPHRHLEVLIKHVISVREANLEGCILSDSNQTLGKRQTMETVKDQISEAAGDGEIDKQQADHRGLLGQ